MFKNLNAFYETENITGGAGNTASKYASNSSSNKTVTAPTISSSTYTNPSNSTLSKGELARLDMFCEEVSSISNQNEHFNHYVLTSLQPLIDSEPLLPEHKQNKTKLVSNLIQ